MDSILVTNRGGKGILTGPRSPRLFDTARMLPDRKRWRDGILYFELTAANIEFIADRHPNAVWEGEAAVEKSKIEKMRQAQELVKEQKNLDELTPIDFPFKTKPFDHQMKVFQISRDSEAFGLFMEMGTGKTKVVIDTMAHLYMKGEIDSVLILAINGVHTQWIEEQLPDHMPEHIPWKGMCFYSKWTKAMQAEFESLKTFPGLKIFAVATESMSHKKAVDIVTGFAEAYRPMIIVDESSLIKNHKAKRTESIYKLRNFSSYRRILSGTPVTQGVEDLYSQLSFLNPNILGFKSYYTFRNHFCVMGGYENKQIVSYKNMEELQEKLDGHSYRVLKSDCLDLPEKVFMNRYVELTDKQFEIYEKLRMEFLAEITEDETITAALAVTRLMRLQQILCGHLPSQVNSGEILDIPSNRIQALMDAVDEVNGKAVVWARFRYDGREIQKALKKAGIGHVVYGAGTPQDQREESIRKFREDPDCKIFLGNPAVGGMGLNLTVADTCIYYSMSFMLEQFLQSQDRIHRIGQKNTCTYVLLEAPKTIDTKIIRAMKQKKQIADTVLDIREIIS